MTDNIALPAARPSVGTPGRLLSPVQQAGTGIFALLLVMIVFGPIVSPYAPAETVCAPFSPPSSSHLLGCNDAGQDLLTGILAGGRVSLAIGLATALATTVLATVYAVTAAYRGGVVDLVAMRVVDAVMALPFLPLIIVLGAFLGGSVFVQVTILCLVMWAQPVRELRAQTLNLRSADYVDASRAMRASAWRIVTRHIVPELAPLIVPQFVRVAHNAILIESSLSFLGLGDPIRKSWGTILFHANARTAFLTDSWLWWVMPPGLLIALSVVALALIGHGIGDRRGDGTAAATPRRGDGRPRRTDRAFETADVTVAYGNRRVADRVSLSIAQGETLGVVGESGSGKSTVAMAALRLLPPAGRIDGGSAWLGSTDLLGLPVSALAAVRGRRVALIPQSAMNALNPVQTVRTQIVEAVRLHRSLPRRRAYDRAAALLDLVRLSRDRLSAYPHELSGGMRQRVVIAIALANDPEVLIADEPTTGLDVLVQAEIMTLLRALSARLGLTVLFVTHDLPLIMGAAARLAIMQAGRVVEEGAPGDLATSPRHGHTRALFDSVPRLRAAKRWRRDAPSGPVLLDIDDVAVTFNRGFAARLRGASPVPAVRGVSLRLHAGEVVGLVGGSGSGKTTLARIALGLVAPDRGRVTVVGEPPRPGSVAHMVFQDPYQSMRPAMRVGDVVAEPLRIAGKDLDPVAEAVAAVRLPNDPGFLNRPVGSLSGGQRQRVAFARAIVTRPRLILADEPTSMLDQSLRAGLLGLMEDLRRDRGAAFLFITHDLPIARHFCDRIAVMQDGRIVEQGPADEIAFHPRHAYTTSLIAAAEAP